MTLPFVVAITGASGAIYARRLLQVLLTQGSRSVHLICSPSARLVIHQELGVKLSGHLFAVTELWKEEELDEPARKTLVDASSRLVQHGHMDFMSSIASGSHRTDGMVICPCSGSTLSAVATGASQNLVHRAAEVHLKEGRKLILVPREMPLSLIHLDNLKRVAEAGAIVAPAAPGWYHGVRSLDDLVDFVVARILDQLDFEHSLMKRWGDDE